MIRKIKKKVCRFRTQIGSILVKVLDADTFSYQATQLHPKEKIEPL